MSRLYLNPINKATVGVRVNAGHPLSKNLAFCCLPNFNSGGVIDLVTPRISNTTSIDWTTGVYDTNAGNWSFTANSTFDLDITVAPFSVGAYFYLQSVPTGLLQAEVLTKASYTSESVNSGWEMCISGPSQLHPGYAFNVFHNNAVALYGLNYNTGVASGRHQLIHTSDGTTRNLYLDSVLVATTTNSPVPLASGATLINLPSTGTIRVPLFAGWVWKRALGLNEVRMLYANPYQMLEFPRTKFFSNYIDLAARFT